MIFVQVTFAVENGSVMKASIKATATELTPILLTQHTYWYTMNIAPLPWELTSFSRNLDAFQGQDDILNHELRIDGDTMIETDAMTTLPTGKLLSTEKTRFDFSTPQAIGARFSDPGERFTYCISL